MANENFFQEHKIEENKWDKRNKVESQEIILQQHGKAKEKEIVEETSDQVGGGEI